MMIALGSDTGNVNNNNNNATCARVRHSIGRLTVEELKDYNEWGNNVKACENSLRELTEMIRKNTEITKKRIATTMTIERKKPQEMIKTLQQELFGEQRIDAKVIEEKIEENNKKKQNDKKRQKGRKILKKRMIEKRK